MKEIGYAWSYTVECVPENTFAYATREFARDDGFTASRRRDRKARVAIYTGLVMKVKPTDDAPGGFVVKDIQRHEPVEAKATENG